ncbi:MAG: NUDIX domain-containing protein [Candidatus Yanofskybacteria bacterium]|nr:NUDIX domain-containing protein [Candidatus Yanofskybacteria bacterium]
MKTKYGLPLANADNILEVVKSLGIASWKIIANPVAVKDYQEVDLTSQEIKIKRRFETKISQFLNPNGEVFKGFHLTGGSGTRVFTVLDEDFVPVCAEFQHGCGEIIFDLPGGNLELDEDPAVCAKREFEDESGIVLERVVSLGSKGMPVSARSLDARNFSFIGVAKCPLVVNSQSLDKSEFLKVVLVNLSDWLKLIEREMVQSYSASTTLLAMRRLKMFETKKRGV